MSFCTHENGVEYTSPGATVCADCGVPVCDNRLYENEPGCTLAPGHEGWHTDGWSSWLTDANDNIIERQSFI